MFGQVDGSHIYYWGKNELTAQNNVRVGLIVGKAFLNVKKSVTKLPRLCGSNVSVCSKGSGLSLLMAAIFKIVAILDYF